MLEILEKLYLVEDILCLIFRLVRQLDLLYYILLIFLDVMGQVGVTECTICNNMYPWPIIF